MKRRILTLIFMLILISLLCACEADIVEADSRVESIAVDGMPQYYYFVGDELDLNEAKLYVQYENGEIDFVPLTKSMLDPNLNMNYPGVIDVKISYKEAQTTIRIEVLDLIIEKVELKTMPTKTTYIEGTDFEVAGATIDVFFEGGRVINVDVLRNNVTQYNPNIVGNQTVRITYRGNTLNIPIVIEPKQLESISVKTLPTNKAIFVGHDINPAGMVLNFHYNNRIVEEVNAKDLPNLEFIFDNTRETPSAQVQIKYTIYTGVDSFKDFFTTFRIQILKRLWKSMRIVEYPVTKGILLEPAQYDEYGNLVRSEVRTPSTNMQNIIQGDSIDLSTGHVEVTFDDDTKQTYLMSDHLLKVYNQEAIERAEIQGLTIEPIEKKDVPSGDCIIDYSIKISQSQYIYENDPEIKITAKNKSGAAVPVIKREDKSLIEVDKGELYTITITASVISTQVIDNVEQDVLLITSKSFNILAEGAVETRRTLDISAAGSYKLSIIYMENSAWSIPMNVVVVSRRPVELELDNYQDVTNPEKPYVLGDKVNISFVKFRLIYDNGEIDDWAPVTTRMLSPQSTLNCDRVTTLENPKTITFVLYGVTSQALTINVVPLGVDHLEIDPPINTYVAQGSTINPSGGLLTAYMNNNTKRVFDLNSIIGIGEDFAQIINDPNSNDNSLISEDTPYIATVYYKQKAVTFEYYVVERLVESLQLIRDENVKTTYYENQPLDLTGLSIRVKWRNSSITQTLPVSMDMLYKYDKHKTGPQTLRIRYRGVLNETFSIVVIPREIDEITIIQKPPTLYVYNDSGLDLSGIRINKKYNDGTEEVQIGIQLGLDGFGYGWISNENQIDFKLLDIPQTVILYYYDYFHSQTPLTVSYEITVKTDVVEEIYLNHPNDPNPSDLIAIVSKGMDLNLYQNESIGGQMVLERTIIYVKYKSLENIREVVLTPNMIRYEKSDVTVGDRLVEVVYNNASCYGYVRVVNTAMNNISVEKAPKTEYIIGEELDLNGGIVRRSFYNSDTDQTTYDYLPMLVEGITVTGFDTSLTESDYAPDENYKERLITVYYQGFSYSFNIRIYKKFNARISYFSTVSFYGNVSLPYTSVNVDVEGFVLPLVDTQFINLVDVMEELPAGAIEETTMDEWGNILTLRYNVDSVYYIKIILENGTIGYVEEEKIMKDNDYPTSPPQGQNKYLILVRVQGNRYYNAVNYAQREFRIINKYINVNAVVPNENAIVWRYDLGDPDDNARAVYLVSNFIEERIMQDSSLNMILASPTYDGFEIVITSYGANDLTLIKEDLENEILKAGSNFTCEERIGVNYRIFDEESDDIFSFYVPLGGLIAVRRPSDNLYVMELFTGHLYRSDFERFDVLYNVNGTLINGFDIEDDQLNQITTVVAGYEIRIQLGQGTSLTNPNYFINFETQQYIIAPKPIVELEFTDSITEYDEEEDIYYNIVRKGYDGLEKHIDVRYRIEENGVWHTLDKDQIRYYLVDGDNEIPYEEGTYPKNVGLYRARITHNYTAQMGYESLIDWDCYFEII